MNIYMEKFAYYTDAFKKYTKFDGRANLSQFWYFILFNLVISIVINMISQKLGLLYSLVVFLPSLTIGARRLHDIGKSGWMQLVGLIPLVGWIWLIVLFVRKGDSEKNDYGPAEYHTHSNDNLEAKFDNISDKVKDLGKKVSEKADELAEKAEDLGEKVSDKVENLADKVSDKVEDVVKDVKK
ncbi:MAG: DUF805 domain-containing protein [Candidatus Pacebacteria bacterium]|nr:DUF805 domain-containing protein [Candidatus Paceibacterota bacterium]